MNFENKLGLGLVRQPKQVLFGPGQRRQLPMVAAGLGEGALVVTDARMATTDDFKAMHRGLVDAGFSVTIYSDALPDLPRSNIIDATKLCAGKTIDFVIGIGGGSCLDLAKAVAVMLVNGGDVRSYFGEFKVPAPGLPVIAIPTTGGTGAEVTSLAIVFDEEQGMKMAIADAKLEPYAAIIDPELTISCPPGLTAATGADALSHLVESFTSRPKNPTPDQIAREIYVGKNRITDMFCIEGLSLMNGGLVRVMETPGDLSARADVMFAAYCAGMAINTTGTAAAHAVQSPMAAIGHTPHGIGVGALLPYVMRFNLPYATRAFADMAGALGVARPDAAEPDNARAAITRIDALLDAIGVPFDIETIGIAPKDFDQIARSSVLARRLVLNNPAPMTEQSVKALLERAHAGDRSWWTLD